MYPRVLIDIEKLKHNINHMISLCNKNKIDHLFIVTKLMAGDKNIINLIENSNVKYIADSRLENLEIISTNKIKVLLRLPMHSEIDQVVNIADISLNSEISTIKLLNEAAKKQNIKHQIILMFDIGDLREGIWYKDNYNSILDEIVKLTNIDLIGIGTNLTCYGGVIATRDKMIELVNIKEMIEKNYDIKLDIISGGNSSSLYLFDEEKSLDGINCLRLGESVFLGKETAFQNDIDNMYIDVFMLETEIIELKEKPSIPEGEIGFDAFGKKPSFVDKGIITRAIVGIGKQDVDFKELEPYDDGVEILGSSSDHLILNIKDNNYKVGDIIRFKVNYGSLLQLMTSNYIKKTYKK